MSEFDPVRIGVVSVSDRASTGVYEDKGIPALQAWLSQALRNPIIWETRLIQSVFNGSNTLYRKSHSNC